jgi:GNAT superfamily N-acetyltransferase
VKPAPVALFPPPARDNGFFLQAQVVRQLLIRPLVPTDRALWEPLWQGYLAFYKASVPPHVTELTFERLTGRAEPMGGFIALDGETPLGMAHWITHRATWTAGDYCYLEDLFVSPHNRGTGTGRRLIEAVCEKARAMACAQVYWLTHETNSTAMQLYDRIAAKSGFIHYRKAL